MITTDLDPDMNQEPIISTDNQIHSFFHCFFCLQQMPDEGYTQLLEVGYTPVGLQVWCKTHNVNIIHIDFSGQKHWATTAHGDGATQ